MPSLGEAEGKCTFGFITKKVNGHNFSGGRFTVSKPSNVASL